ncbi:MAG: hypothetical protein EOP88_12520 [Verrucomicrobiaceae bacterium]|nr:MAG: hypothetical protein EOP88_12520 [Verrucomicrobiaceae bacterium]
MTYRRLFLWLLLGSTLALAALWAWSCQGLAEVRVRQGPSYGSYRAGIWSGTLILRLSSPEPRPTNEEAQAVPLQSHFGLPSLDPDDWQVSWTPGHQLLSSFRNYPRTGKLALQERLTHVMVKLGMIYPRKSYQLDLPLWMAWLLMVGVAFAVTRWLESRSMGWQEKKLAEGDRVDRIQGDPS